MYTRQQLALAARYLAPCPKAPEDLHCPAEVWAAFAAGPWSLTASDHRMTATAASGHTLEVNFDVGKDDYAALQVKLQHDGVAHGAWHHRPLPRYYNFVRCDMRVVLYWLWNALATVKAPTREQTRMRDWLL